MDFRVGIFQCAFLGHPQVARGAELKEIKKATATATMASMAGMAGHWEKNEGPKVGDEHGRFIIGNWVTDGYIYIYTYNIYIYTLNI